MELLNARLTPGGGFYIQIQTNMHSTSLSIGLLALLKRSWTMTPEVMPSILHTISTMNELFIKQNVENAEAFILVVEKVLDQIAGQQKN